jgi:glycosyltransferase involved in cell wall biosynthesis
MEKGISILICTYNGATRLPETLRHLALQSMRQGISWEIIVVDNASTDNTFELVTTEWAKYGVQNIDFTVVKEPKPGKIHALETGVQLVKYAYFIHCDDDNQLSKNYVQITYDILESNPRIGAVGGQSIAITDSGVLPDWFEAYKEGYAVGEQGTVSGDITSRGFLFGASLGTRSELYKEIYRDFPSFLVGRQGALLSSGEDSEYCQRLILRDYKLYYETGLIFHHYIPEERLHVSYRDRLFAGFEDANAILVEYYLINKIRQKVKLNTSNRLRLLIISPIRILFAGSAKKREEQTKILRYLLNMRSSKHPIFNAIHKFDRHYRHDS